MKKIFTLLLFLTCNTFANNQPLKKVIIKNIYPFHNNDLFHKELLQQTLEPNLPFYIQPEETLYKTTTTETLFDKINILQNLPFYKKADIPEINTIVAQLEEHNQIKLKSYNPYENTFTKTSTNIQPLQKLIEQLIMCQYSSAPLNAITSRKQSFTIKESFFNILSHEDKNDKNLEEHNQKTAAYQFFSMLWHYNKKDNIIFSLDPDHTKSINDLMILAQKARYLSNYYKKNM